MSFSMVYCYPCAVSLPLVEHTAIIKPWVERLECLFFLIATVHYGSNKCNWTGGLPFKVQMYSSVSAEHVSITSWQTETRDGRPRSEPSTSVEHPFGNTFPVVGIFLPRRALFGRGELLFSSRGHAVDRNRLSMYWRHWKSVTWSIETD